MAGHLFKKRFSFEISVRAVEEGESEPRVQLGGGEREVVAGRSASGGLLSPAHRSQPRSKRSRSRSPRRRENQQVASLTRHSTSRRHRSPSSPSSSTRIRYPSISVASSSSGSVALGARASSSSLSSGSVALGARASSSSSGSAALGARASSSSKSNRRSVVSGSPSRTISSPTRRSVFDRLGSVKDGGRKPEWALNTPHYMRRAPKRRGERRDGARRVGNNDGSGASGAFQGGC